MSRHENFDNSTWRGDEEFGELSPPSKLLYIWSWTNPDCGMSGVYRIGRRQMAHDTGLERGAVEVALAELEASRFVFYHEGWLWVRSRVKRFRTRTMQVAKAVVRDLHQLPAGHPFWAAFCAEYEERSGGSSALDELLFEAKAERHRKHGAEPESEGHVNLSGGSREGHPILRTGESDVKPVSPVNAGNSVRVTRGSREPIVTHSISSSCSTETYSEDVERLCLLLSSLIVENGARKPTITDRWRKECRRLIERDKRPVEEIERVVRWCQADEFWQANVLSMPTLRKQFDRLLLRANQENGQHSTAGDDEFFAAMRGAA